LADWTTWPYHPDLLQYAQNDVFYPKLIWQKLKQTIPLETLQKYGVTPMKTVLKLQVESFRLSDSFANSFANLFGSRLPFKVGINRSLFTDNVSNKELLECLWCLRRLLSVGNDMPPEELLSFAEGRDYVQRAENLSQVCKSRSPSYSLFQGEDQLEPSRFFPTGGRA
ncbi:unnamed protein product, partial [Allacma fusca]